MTTTPPFPPHDTSRQKKDGYCETCQGQDDFGRQPTNVPGMQGTIHVDNTCNQRRRAGVPDKERFCRVGIDDDHAPPAGCPVFGKTTTCYVDLAGIGHIYIKGKRAGQGLASDGHGAVGRDCYSAGGV